MAEAGSPEELLQQKCLQQGWEKEWCEWYTDKKQALPGFTKENCFYFPYPVQKRLLIAARSSFHRTG
jgi:hypothetical protein